MVAVECCSGSVLVLNTADLVVRRSDLVTYDCPYLDVGLRSVLMLDPADMAVRYPALATDDCSPDLNILAMAISNDGATIATARRDDYFHEPRRLFIDDRMSHVLREIRPWRSRRG